MALTIDGLGATPQALSRALLATLPPSSPALLASIRRLLASSSLLSVACVSSPFIFPCQPPAKLHLCLHLWRPALPLCLQVWPSVRASMLASVAAGPGLTWIAPRGNQALLCQTRSHPSWPSSTTTMPTTPWVTSRCSSSPANPSLPLRVLTLEECTRPLGPVCDWCWRLEANRLYLRQCLHGAHARAQMLSMFSLGLACLGWLPQSTGMGFSRRAG